MRPNVHCASVVKYAQRSVNKGKSITLHAIAKAERVVERGTATRKFPVNSNGRMERLMCNFHLLAIIAHPTSPVIRTANKS